MCPLSIFIFLWFFNQLNSSALSSIICTVYIYGHKCPWSPEEFIWSPGAGVTDVRELPYMGTENWIQVLCNSMIQVKKGMFENMTNTKSLFKSCMETYCCRTFLKYIHTWEESKWSHNIMGETMSQLGILCHQIKPTVAGMSCILLSYCPKGASRLLPNIPTIAKTVGYTPTTWK